MGLLHDGIDIREPEIHIKLSDSQDDSIAAMLDHFLEVLLRVLYVVKAIIADSGMFDSRTNPPISFCVNIIASYNLHVNYIMETYNIIILFRQIYAKIYVISSRVT